MSQLSITEGVRDALLRDVRERGAAEVETGAFLLVDSTGPATVLALAGQTGIIRRKDVFSVSGKALARLFVWAGERELRVAAQVHSHGGRAFLSETDLRHGFSVRGFITAVVPRYRRPPADPAAWGWWRYDGEWIEHLAPVVTPGPAEVVEFDEEGVRAR